MDIIARVDVMCAGLATLCFFLVVAKFVTKRLGPKSIDKVLMKLHKPIGCILVLTGAIHMACSFRLIAEVSIWIYILGALCLISIILTVIISVMKSRNPGKWLRWHRLFTLLSITTLVLHLARLA